MKPILPKGTIAIKCLDDAKNFQSILTPPGTTILVIPSNNNKCDGSFMNIKVLPATSTSTLTRPLCNIYDSQDPGHNDSTLKTSETFNKPSSAISINEDRTSAILSNSKKRTKLKAGKLLKNKRKNTTEKLKKVNDEAPIFLLNENIEAKSRESSFRNEEYEKNYPENVSDLIDLHTRSDRFYEIKDNPIPIKEKPHSFNNGDNPTPLKEKFHSINNGDKLSTKNVSSPNKSKLFFCENSPKDFYTDSNSNDDCISRPHNLEITNLRVGSPPSYEAHVCNSSKVVVEVEESIDISSNELNNNIISLPLSYSQSPQENDVSLYTGMSPNSNSYALSSNRMESTSNLTAFYTHDHLHYNCNDNHAPNFPIGESSINLNSINYYYESVVTVKDYDAETKQSSVLYNCNPSSVKDYRVNASNFDSNNWYFANCNDDEPRDYSNNSGSNSVLHKHSAESLYYSDSFIENAKRESSLFKEENESSYEERRKLASSVLNTTGTDSERKKALKENFWIVEDEPLEESIFLKNEQSKQDISDDLKLLLSKPKLPREYICHICGKMLKGRSSLRSHIHLHLNYKPYECQYCSRKFTQSSILKNHLRTHTGETPYSCHICGKSFKTLSILRKHFTKHSRLRTFKCSVCSKAFKSKIDLQSHLKIHAAGPHSCRICKTLFDTRKSLSTHIQRKHKNQKKFFCTICNKGYGLRCLLKQHMNVHSNEQKHTCYVCGASYVWKSGLAAHLRTHSFKIQCEICGVKFISLKKLEKHRSRHSEPYPHKCPKCEKQFKFSYLLKKHLAKHKDELSCLECGIGFMTKTKLKKHKKVHIQN